jgi:hypothetical protein
MKPGLVTVGRLQLRLMSRGMSLAFFVVVGPNFVKNSSFVCLNIRLSRLVGLVKMGQQC